ncbi:MAG TPA: hypothetical protein VFT67_15930 [Jatrophihabitantaceae bacterium]|nr:hypothetical protein [Jatrophihabitantaceae bacterium]
MSDRDPVRLLLMADYLADPLWYRSTTGVGESMVSLERLQLSADLKSRLRAWARRFDALMDTDYEWPSRMEEATWEAAGRALLEPLREELGPGYDVQYFDGGSQGSE